MNDIRFLVGDRIRTLRKALGISQETLALKAGLDRTYVASVENGKRNISIINVQKLAIALNSSMNEFFDSNEFKNRYARELSRVAEKDPQYVINAKHKRK